MPACDEPGAGHRRGAASSSSCSDGARDLGIAELTVWALSNENLSRRRRRARALLDIIAQELAVLSGRTPHAAEVRIRVFGRIDALPPTLAETARRVQAETSGNDGLCLNVALGYSGRDELVDATRA